MKDVIPEAVKVIPTVKTNNGEIKDFLVVNERTLLLENVEIRFYFLIRVVGSHKRTHQKGRAS